MATNLAALPYVLGKPGMVATTTYKQTRQHMLDSFWVNTLDKIMYFGTACILKNDVLDTADATGGQFIGVYLDDDRYVNRLGYAQKEKVNVGTNGDFWVRVDPAVTIKVLDKVQYLEATKTVGSAAVGGFFTNAAAAAGIIAVPKTRFLTPNINGLAVIGLGMDA